MSTPEKLSAARALIEKRLREKQSAGPSRGIRPREGGGPAPLSFAQQRLWFLHRMDPNGAAYNVFSGYRLSGPVNAGAMARAVAALAERHPALRTGFREEAGEPVQVIDPVATLALGVDDLSALPDGEREEALRRLAAEQAHGPFDLSAAPLARLRLVRLGGEDHALLVAMHHIVSDGWSLGVIVRELAALYDAAVRGTDAGLAPLDIAPADHAVWQRGLQASGEADRQLAWWRERMAGAPATLELATDRPRPATQSFRGGCERATLSPAELDRLQALGREESATPFIAVLSAWALLLARYAGQDEVVVGTPTAGRPLREMEGLVGFFVDTLALRLDVSGQPTFRELVRRVRAATLGAFEHADVPFERVVEAVSPERVPGRNPLFQVMCTWQAGARAASAPSTSSTGLRMAPMEADVDVEKFDLSLSFTERRDGLGVSLRYAADLFDGATAGRMLGHLCTLLRAALADPDAPALALPLESAEERETVAAWSGTSREYPRDASIAGVFAARAAGAPDAVALSFAGGEMTYGELDRLSDRVAHALAARGVAPGDVVGVCLERGPHAVAAILGVLKAGGAYLPLDPAHPAERRAFMLDDARATAVVVVGDAEGMEAAGRPALRMEGGLHGAADAPFACPAGGGDAAYVLYTSGSTGTPKGVQVPHRAVLRLVLNTGYARFGAGEVFLQLAPLAFDASTLELWGALLHGARLVVPPAGAPTLEQLGRLLRDEGVTTLWLTAGLFHLVADERLDDLAGVRQLLAGGDVLSPGHVGRVLRAHPALRLINGYGPTENTTFTTCHAITPADVERGSIPIGRPIANTTVHVLDARRLPVPVGVPGELYTGGDGLALGYLNRPELTEAAFVTVPVNGRPERLYRTGDRVRWLADGTLEFLGRVDFQVKIRGFRIEPGEVESALLAHAGVRDATVMAREDVPGDRRLVAYVVAADGAEVDAAGVRAHLKGALPDYMVPSAIVMMPALPLNANGKVDRRALPAPDADAAAGGAPLSPTGELVAGIWAGLLNRAAVGADDDFFALGGHSLLATRVVSRVRDALGVELPLRALFEAPVLADFAARVDEARLGGAPMVPPVCAGPRPERVPLSFAQERLWMLEQMEPGTALFNVPRVLRMEGALDVDALGRALSEIVRRHEVLRTVFTVTGDQPAQVVCPPRPMMLAVEDLTGLEGDARRAEARRRAGEESSAPFDLAAGPLLRARVLKLAGDEHTLLLTLHHAVTDGWSTGVLQRELSALYRAFSAGEASPLPELPLQYADYAVWQRTHLAGPALEAQAGYWTDRLAGAPGLLNLPTDRPRPLVQSHRGAHEQVAIPAELSERLRALGRREGATLFMTLLGAFKLLLSRWSGQHDVVVGTSIAGRTRAEMEGLIGLFINAVVLRTDLSGNPTFRELLARVRETTLGAYDHQDLPFEQLVQALQPERTLSYTPLFQVMFDLHSTPPGRPDLSGLRISGVAASVSASKYDLTVALGDGPDGVYGTVEYNTDIFDRATIQRLFAQYLILLDALAADPAAPIGRAPLLAAEERNRVLHAWNPAPSPFPSEVCVHTLFERQADATPAAVALEWNGGSMSYREMEGRANQLAHRLRTLGVGPETRVGVLTHRGPEMMIGIFAVMKAGGAYVGLDHTHPADRIGYTLADSGAAVLLTEAGLADKAAGFTGSIVMVDAWDALASEPMHRVASGVTADNLAYVYYTSGSTGRPKGVQMHHRGVANYIHWACGHYGVASGNGSPVFTSIAVDLTVTAFLPLFAGTRVVLVAEGPGVDALADLLKTKPGFSHIKITPTHLSLLTPLLSAGEARACAGALVIGADTLRAESTLFWRDNAPNVRLLNEYGPTETVVGCAIYEAPAAGPESGPVPIGRPIDNLAWYVLDERMEPAPVGVPGELYIGGVGVARGYGNRPAMTAEKFIPNPFSSIPGDRLYRTGDRARWLAGGQVEFLGRADFQVKIRGYRVETGEVESVLMADPRISKALAVIREDVPGDHRLVGYVVPAPGQAAPSVGEMRALLKEKLPEYMVPGAFVFLTEADVPTTGKISPRQLPPPSGERADDDGYVAPRDETERALAGIWAEVLRLSRVGVDDNFFELGGDSILSIQVVARAARAGIRLSARQMFQHQTVAGLAAVAGLARAAATEAGPVTGNVPLIPVQRWFLEQDMAHAHHYNQSLLLRPATPFHPGALDRALTALVEQHDALRFHYERGEGGWVQRAQAPAPVAAERVDLSAVPAGERRAALADALARAQASLRLEGPVFRAVLLELGDGEQRLLLAAHHLVVDVVSWGVLKEDLEVAYRQAEAGEPVRLAPRTTSYRQWAARLAEYAASPALAEEAGFWAAEAAAADAPIPAAGTGNGGVASQRMVGATLGEDETRALLHDVPAVYHTAINDALLAALALAFAPWTGSRALRVDLEGHGREPLWDDMDLSRTVGWFTSLYPVRLDLAGTFGAGEALCAVKEQLRRVPARGIGYGVLRWLAGEAVAAPLRQAPAPRVSFNYLGQLDGGLAADGWLRAAPEPRGPENGPGNPRPYLLDVLCSVSGGRLRVQVGYSEQVHDRGAVQALADRFVAELAGIVDHCRAPEAGGYTPSDFPEAELSQNELDELMAELS